MKLFEGNNRNLIISLLIPILTGLLSPIITYGLNLGILFQIPQYLIIWAISCIVPAILFHYAKTREDFAFRKYAIHVGYCFIPMIISNILTPIIQLGLTVNLDNVYDIDVIRQASFNWALQVAIFFYIFIPLFAFCAFIVLLGFSMKKVYDISLVKTILIAIPITILAVGVSSEVGWLIGLLF